MGDKNIINSSQSIANGSKIVHGVDQERECDLAKNPLNDDNPVLKKINCELKALRQALDANEVALSILEKKFDLRKMQQSTAAKQD